MTLQDIKNYIIARIFPNTSQAITGATMQDTLLQMAESMNTPSGDPMHYAYEAEGAVWNATTGYWEMYDMTDITNEQMRRAYNLGHFNSNDVQPLYASLSQFPACVRFNLPRTGAYAYYSTSNSLASGNACIEFINLTPMLRTTSICQITNMKQSFYNCSSLRRIFGDIEMSLTTNVTEAFSGCYSLVSINIRGLKQNISFADSPILSKESLLYMINNSASNATFTITLHPDVHAKCEIGEEWYDDIFEALTLKQMDSTNITLGK